MVGGVMLAEVTIDLGKGKQHTLYMAKLDLDNPELVGKFEAVDKFRANHRNIEAKLWNDHYIAYDFIIEPWWILIQ